MISNYIEPITKIHSSFAETKEFFDKFGGISWFGDEKPLDLSALIQGKRNLIVGEPGVGKTLLLQRIKEHLDEKAIRAEVVSLRRPEANRQIDEFVAEETTQSKTLLLDALDEVKSSLLPSVIQKLEELSSAHPEIQLFLSSRWVFIARHAPSFPEYRLITISPFTRAQVRRYLLAAGRTDEDVDSLLNRIMSFGHQRLVIQVPRYLSYLDEFLREKGWQAAS